MSYIKTLEFSRIDFWIVFSTSNYLNNFSKFVFSCSPYIKLTSIFAGFLIFIAFWEICFSFKSFLLSNFVSFKFSFILASILLFWDLKVLPSCEFVNPESKSCSESFLTIKSKCSLLLNFSLNAPFVKSVSYLPDLIYF